MKKRLLFLCCAVFCCAAHVPGQTYNPGDIAVINAVIDNNGLQWTKAEPADGSFAPADWTGVTWSDDETGKRITGLDVNTQSLTDELDVTGLTALTYLNCGDNQLASLKVTGLTALNDLNCTRNQITALDASNLTNLLSLNCGANRLVTLNVSGSSHLEFLNCSYNVLASLDVSSLTDLREFWCHTNELAQLDVSNLTGLEILVSSFNRFTSLDVSQLTALRELYCNGNLLTSLDLSKQTGLQSLECNGNQLIALDLSGSTGLVDFSGADQKSALVLSGNNGNFTANVTFGDGATFDNTALSYGDGVLTSTSDAAIASGFASPAGLPGFALSGMLTLSYTTTGVEHISTDVKVLIWGDLLSVDSPVVESVQVYSLTGALLYHFQKPAGEASFSVNRLQDTAVIVRGGSGWVRKVVN
ncbi:MAG: hypothetical protein LBE91_04970 [Tannerella sp.]|jgi:hypothetical protein|nr:hypothetical protein [Tannerella sp.]